MFRSILLPTSLGLSKKKLLLLLLVLLHGSLISTTFWTTLKMEAEYSSATLLLILQHRPRHIQED